MKKRLISMLMVLVMVMGIIPTTAFAASSEEEALGEVDIYNGGTALSYLSINGRVRELIYTYYNYTGANGKTREIPAYCVNPNTKGVPQTVAPGESIEYLAEEKTSDPKVLGIVASGYPTRGLGELKLQDKYEAYYATKMALWTYLLSHWDINNLRVNPNLTGNDLTAARRVLAAAKDIYARGTAWTETLSPSVKCTPDRDVAYDVTVNGKAYKQQVFTFWSKTWVCDYTVSVAFTDPASVPAGTRIVDMENNDITTITTSGTGDGYAGKFKVLYPADAVAGKTGSAQLSFSTNVYQYAVFYATCAEVGKYGELQNYMVDTDPTTVMRLSAYSNYADEPTETPDTGLKIIKYETGTTIPLEGARFEVIDPDGASVGVFVTNSNGEIIIPLTKVGNFTVIERDAPDYYLMCEDPAQNVTVVYDEVAEVTFFNDPYGSLRVEKKSNTGMNLPGAVITIEHIESGVTYTQTTNSAGCAMFTEIKPGAYRVQEQTAPVGWQLDDTVFTTTVVPGEVTTIPIINEELPGLRIIKYDRKNMVALPDVTFEIWRDGVSLGKYRTDEFGEILLTDVEPGTYRAVEVDTGNDGLILDTTPQEVELEAGDGIKELVFFNDTKPGMRLIKVDSNDPSKVIPNAVFEIKSVAGDYGPEEFTTDQNGEIDLSKLPAGAYVVTEKSCPGYVIDEAQRIIQLDPNEDAQFVFTNSIKPSLHLIKLSSDGTPLEGATFRIAKIEDGSHYLDRTTNAQGEILISDLEPGVYSVRETATTADHIIDVREHHVELFPGQVSTIVLENQKRPNLIVYKHDADTGKPIPNTVFVVSAADGHSVDEIKTDSEGKAVLENLLPGVYEIHEKFVPGAYLLDAPDQLVTLYPNRDHTAYFENHKKPSLTVNKVDSVTGDPIEGAKFQVWYASNNTNTGEYNDLGYFYSDENGQFFVDALRDGWYKISEIEPPSGYALKDPSTQEVYIKGGEAKTVTFENVPLSALIVWKYDSVTGEAVKNAVFQLKYLGGTSGSGGTVIGTYKTSANGSFTVTGLKEGTYIVEELASDSGHVIDTAPQTVYISGKQQDVVELFFGNSPKGSLLIKKIDSITHEPLSDVEFFVTDSTGAVVGNANGKFVTDSQGTILIDGIAPGTTLVVKETRALDDYILDDTPQTARIKAGQTVTLEFRNQPKGCLIITKIDSVTHKPLSGVQFEIKGCNGCEYPAGTYTTDSNGMIRLSHIPSGCYSIVETKVKDGYLLDDTVHTVKVEAGTCQEVTIENEPLGGLLIKKMDAVTKEPLADVIFKVTRTDGTVVGASDGEYRTDERGFISIPDLEPGGYVVQEVKSKDGYLLDDTPKNIEIKDHQTYTMEFFNQPLGGLIIHKLDSATKEPLEGVQFKVTYADGSFVPDEGGKLSSNGLYFTDENGQITINGVVGTLVVTEVETIPGYTIHEESRSQTVVVNPDDTQHLYFYNDPVGGVEIIKVNADDKSERIPNTTFEIRRVDDGLVDTVTTDKNGRVFLSLQDGAYYAVETEAAEDFKLDSTPIYFEVKDGKTTTLTVTNKALSGIIIHKIDSVTGDGIYGVKFVLYNANKKPIGEYTTDQDGYIYIDDAVSKKGGRFYLRELEAAEGYELDDEYKTVYVKPGKTIEIEWENTPITAQIQVHKYAAEYNEVTGTPAGTPLKGAVYEISHARSGKVVDYITTDARGVAASKPLPLGRYKIVEVTAPAYWQVDPTVHDVTLEYPGQIIKLSAYDKPSNLGVSITKRGNAEVLAGSQMRYDFTVANTSNVPLENFYWHDRIPTDVARATVLSTGTYSARLNYRILYKTNYQANYQVLASNLLTNNNYSFALNAIPMQAGEVVTDIYFDFGKVPVGFQSVTGPTLNVMVLGTAVNGYQMVNRADVGGKYQGTWQTAQANWVTIVRKYGTTPSLPKTGY